MPGFWACNLLESKHVISVKHGGEGSPPGDLDRKTLTISGSAGQAGVAVRLFETTPWGAGLRAWGTSHHLGKRRLKAPRGVRAESAGGGPDRAASPRSLMSPEGYGDRAVARPR